MRIRILLLVFVLLGGAIGSFGTSEAQTQGSPATALPVFDFPQAGVEFLTGDTWRIGGETYRLYGVQSCIRGTRLYERGGRKEGLWRGFAGIYRCDRTRYTPAMHGGRSGRESSDCLHGVCCNCGAQHTRSRHDPDHRRVRVRCGRCEWKADQPHLRRGGGRCSTRPPRPLGRDGLTSPYPDPHGCGARGCATLESTGRRRLFNAAASKGDRNERRRHPGPAPPRGQHGRPGMPGSSL